METSIPGLDRKPFDPASYVETPPAREASAILDAVYRDPEGLGILTGIDGSGRRRILERFASRLRADDVGAVVIDGKGLDRTLLLESVLGDIGYALDAAAPDDMSSMLRVFLIHQCLAGEPAFLAVVNAGEMHPSALEEICRLAEIVAGDERALRIVLCDDERIGRVVAAPAMGPVRDRITARHALRPLDLIETDDYIVQHLKSAGAHTHRDLITDEAIALIWRASKGVPAAIDELALEALQTLDLPIDYEAALDFLGLEPGMDDDAIALDGSEQPTRLVVSLSGRVISDTRWPTGRLLIGRDSRNDICLPSRYVSRRHAMLIVEPERAWIVDLNSTNGVSVNSRRITQTMLRDQDIVAIGHYRLKFMNPAAIDVAPDEDDARFTETVVMRSLEQLPRLALVAADGADRQPAPRSASAVDAGGIARD